MLKLAKNTALHAARALGVFGVMADSRWRQRRLLILCYHGLSLKDEHEWSHLYLTPASFRQRLQILARGRYQVLPLNQAVRMLREGSLPPRSVAITFDDGFHDFYQVGFPMLRELGFPATVYQTTYYSDHPFPVFNLVLSYLFWRGAGRRLDGGGWAVRGVFDLSRDEERDRAVNAFREFARQERYSAAQKNELAAGIGAELGVDYAEILRLRMLQLMTPAQVSEIAAAGVDVQLHTHRHRTPQEESLFVREIRDNRKWLAARTGKVPNHFCYPSGHHRDEFLPWLRAEQVISATTCENGMATRTCEPLLLPRLVDSANVTEVDFEGWLAGVSALLPHRRG
jgi:peptidoglycan/xylan/chitin deacetylase (PgdA/CDA1 family)